MRILQYFISLYVYNKKGKQLADVGPEKNLFTFVIIFGIKIN